LLSIEAANEAAFIRAPLPLPPWQSKGGGIPRFGFVPPWPVYANFSFWEPVDVDFSCSRAALALLGSHLMGFWLRYGHAGITS